MTETPEVKDWKTNIQLTKYSIDVLRNFSTINKSILIKPGKFIETMSVNKNRLVNGTEVTKNVNSLLTQLDISP